MVEPAAITAAHGADDAVPVGILLARKDVGDRWNIGDGPDVFEQFAVELLHAPAAVAEEEAQMAVGGIAVVDN